MMTRPPAMAATCGLFTKLMWGLRVQNPEESKTSEFWKMHQVQRLSTSLGGWTRRWYTGDERSRKVAEGTEKNRRRQRR